MAPVPTQTVLASSASSTLPSTSSISLMPFSLAHDGPARISTFFHPRSFAAAPSTSKGEEEGASPHRQASFRGRRVVSSTLALPSGYRGLVYSTTAPLPPSQDVAAGEEAGAATAEREERAAKRAKRAAASAAAFDADSPRTNADDEAGAEGGVSAVRRSPRKSTTAASSRARERAVRAAKDKARRKSAQDAAKKGGFSLDSDEEAGEQAVEPAGGAPTNVTNGTVDAQVEREPGVDAAGHDLPEAAGTEDKLLSESECKLDAIEVDDSTEKAASTLHFPQPQPPLRTLSSVSTASSGVITSTPRLTSPALSPTKEEAVDRDETAAALAPEDEPVALARDEKRLVPCLTFDHIEVWNPDWPLAGANVAEDDEVGRAITEWIGLAAKIHGY